MQFRPFITLMVVVFVVASGGCASQGAKLNPKNVVATTGVVEATLSNGLKVIVKPDHRAPVVVSQIWYKVGSSYEHAGITGVSHVLEHMMFK